MLRVLTRRFRAFDLAHFVTAEKAATAVEFALIAPAFLATLIAIGSPTRRTASLPSSLP
jgi:Flp pilus assembly pilin Flp